MDDLMNKPEWRWKRRKLRHSLTPAEAALWRVLKGRQVYGLKFRRQHSVGPYILDFYCPELKLAIELDGESHVMREEYDERRTDYLFRVAGITVLRFENRVVFENLEQIIAEIGEKMADAKTG